MKRYQYSQRGLTLFEVSVAISVAIMLLMAFTSFYLKIVERSLIEQTVYRAKLVYEGALAYRIDNKQWPGSITVLTSGSYIPRLAAETSWGEDIFTAVGHSNLIMYIPTPSRPIADSIAARLPAAEVATVGDSLSVTIIPPGQEFSLASLQDLAGTRPWEGDYNADGYSLTNIQDIHGDGTFTAGTIQTTRDVTLEGSCSQEEKGARAMSRHNDNVYPVFCNGTIWKMVSEVPNCEVCIGCAGKDDDPEEDIRKDCSSYGNWGSGFNWNQCKHPYSFVKVKLLCE
jgi:competence protein ComGC